MPDKREDSPISQLGSLELTEELIRIRAYHLFIKHGCQHGHDLDDWLQAEAEVMGTKLGAASDEAATELDTATAAAA